MILALDTATDAITAALADGDGALLAEVVEVAPEGAGRRVLADVDRVLVEAGATMADVGLVAVGRGPGSFTGLRIGLAAGAALADAIGARLVGVSTLDALRRLGPPGAVAVIDARRREVFASGPGIAPAARTPAALAALLPAGATCVGDGAVRYRAVLEAAGAVVPSDDDPAHLPRGGALCLLALEAPGEPTPLYLREPDAVPSGGARGAA